MQRFWIVFVHLTWAGSGPLHSPQSFGSNKRLSPSETQNTILIPHTGRQHWRGWLSSLIHTFFILCWGVHVAKILCVRSTMWRPIQLSKLALLSTHIFIAECVKTNSKLIKTFVFIVLIKNYVWSRFAFDSAAHLLLQFSAPQRRYTIKKCCNSQSRHVFVLTRSNTKFLT